MMLFFIGKLYCNKVVEILVYGCLLLNVSVIDVIKVYCKVCLYEGIKLCLCESYLILEVLSNMKFVFV